VAIYSSDLILTELDHSPLRVVCLVPSTTESLLAFGLGDRLVGVTDFCLLDENIPSIPERVGGTKMPAIERILGLNPDLILANQEENSREAITALAEKGIPIWLSFPKSVDEAIADLWILIRIFNKERELSPRIVTLERSLEWTRRAFLDQPRMRYFCPIWKDASSGWWMTFNQNTYSHTILAFCGGENVFCERERRYPLEAELGKAPAEDPQGRDTRYPRVILSEILAAEPELILLPSEPYAFNSTDLEEATELFIDTPAVQQGQIHLLDGRLITWHGIRMAEAIGALPRYFQSSENFY
jgi:iron complex transport system substrate-binding protein